MNFEIPQVVNIDRRDDFVQNSLEKLRHHDEKTFVHSMEVGEIADFVVKNDGKILSAKEKNILLHATLLHDYGKIGVDAEILNKEGELSQEERKKIQLHPQIGFSALKDWDLDVAKTIVAHHEFQEHAYPRERVVEDVWEKRIEDVQTKKLSRILAMIDSFQAMLAERPGKKNKPKTIDQTICELQKRFVLPGDQEIIMLLEMYYRQKNPQTKVDYDKYIGLVGRA